MADPAIDSISDPAGEPLDNVLVSAAISASPAAASQEVVLTPPLRANSTLAAGMEAFDEYMLRKGFSENTIKAFRNDLKILAGFMESDVKLYQISTQNLEDYLAWMQSERNIPCSAKTLARRITSIKVFFGWLHGIGVSGTDPAEPVAQQPARPPLPIILRDQDVSRLVRAAQDLLWSRHSPDARPYLLVSLLLQTGIKKAECSRLLVGDFNFERPQSPEVTDSLCGRGAGAQEPHPGSQPDDHAGL